MNEKKQTLEEKLAAAKARGAKAKSEPEPEPESEQIMLPTWPDKARSVPNALLRGAIFVVGQEREHLQKWTPIAGIQGIKIRVKGERLNQLDLDLWEQLLHLQRALPLGSPVTFTGHGMLRALGHKPGGTAHARLDDDLGRLLTSATEIRWTATRQSFAGTLITSYFKDEDSGKYVVIFNAETLQLYSQGNTWIDADQRRALGRNLIAKWLHGFYSSHAKPYPYSVDTLWQLGGSKAARYEFRRTLRAALAALVKVGSLKSWEIDENDLVHVVRILSPSDQNRSSDTGLPLTGNGI